MRTCFVSGQSLRSFKLQLDGCFSERFSSLFGEEDVDLLLFGFNGIDEVSYEKELKGESVYFEDAAVLSKHSDAVVVCGCVTDTRGHKRKSALVTENGKILGVSDMLNVVDGEVGCGAAMRIYETKNGRMGVVVADDIAFPETVKALALCGSDFIVCPFGRVIDETQSLLLRANAYFYGIPILFCAKGYCTVVDATGKVVFASPQQSVVYNFQPSKEYHLIETRRRGFR